MSYLDLARDLVKRLEGCRLVGYPDAGGVPTNGYGHTGPEVRVGVAITQEVADHDLERDLAIADERLQSVCDPAGLAGLMDHQRATLISFVFNLGAEPGWEIWKDVDSGKLDDVPTQLRRFTKAKVNGRLVKVDGLVNRREAECVFWNTADAPTAAAVVKPSPASGVLREADTPPTPKPPPAMWYTSLATKGAGLIAGLGAASTQVHDIIAPHADAAKVFQTASTVAIGVGIVCSILLLMIHGEQHQAGKV